MTERIVLPIHGEDHCPGGPDPIPCLVKPWALLYGGFATCPTGTTFPVPWATAIKHNDPDDAFFSWRIDDVGDPGNDRFVLTLEREGIYDIDAVISFDDTGTAPFGGYAAFDLHPVTHRFDDGLLVSADWLSGGEFTFHGFLRIQTQFAVGPLGSELTPFARHTNGVNRDLNGVKLFCMYKQTLGNTTEWIEENV